MVYPATPTFGGTVTAAGLASAGCTCGVPQAVQKVESGATALPHLEQNTMGSLRSVNLAIYQALAFQLRLKKAAQQSIRSFLLQIGQEAFAPENSPFEQLPSIKSWSDRNSLRHPCRLDIAPPARPLHWDCLSPPLPTTSVRLPAFLRPYSFSRYPAPPEIPIAPVPPR